MWITNDKQLNAMVAACEAQGWPLDVWWRNEAALASWWSAQGWPEHTRAGYGAAACGGQIVAWIYKHGPNLWAVESVGPWDGATWHDWSERPNGAGMVTVFNAKDMGGPPKHHLCVPDGWCGWAVGKRLHIARVITVTPVGNAATIVIEHNGETVPAASVGAKRLFPIVGKDEALAWFFERGETIFAGYGAFKAKLWHKQQAVTGVKLERHAKLGRVTGLSDNRPPMPWVEKLAKLEHVYNAAVAEVDQAMVAKLALPEGSAEFRQAAKVQNDLEAIMLKAWEAWDKTHKQWLAELMG